MAKDEQKPRKDLTKKCTNTAKKTTNRPANNLRLNPEDNIAKSKKLVEKIQKRKSTVNSPRSLIRSKDHSRVCSNGKPMPPLSELERMYEDSDDENQSKTVPSQTNKSSTGSSQDISTDKLTSPTTIKKIADKMMDFVSNLPDPTTFIETCATLSPPKKRKKSNCQDPPQVSNRSSTIVCIDDNIDKIGWEEQDKCPRKRAKKSKSGFDSDNISAWLQDCEKGANSDGSNDSNKTVDYDYMKTPPTHNVGRPQPFSPLPSTSKDSETINKNDQLFNESLIIETSMSNNQSKINETSVDLDHHHLDADAEVKLNEIKKEGKMLENTNATNSSDMEDIEIIHTPCETIVIDDEILPNIPIMRKCNNKSDIIECIDIDETVIKKDSPKVAEYSDAIVIDDEDGYKFINDSPPCDEITEVIDIDDIIAENKAIIEKYSKKSDKDINTVTCVDTTSISHLNTAKSEDPCKSSDRCDATNEKRKDNIVSKSVETTNTQKNNIQDIVTDYFSNNSNNQNLVQENLPRNAPGTSLWNKVTDWLNNLTPNYATNNINTSRNRTQNVDTSNDSVIIIDDIPSPSNPSRPSEAPNSRNSPCTTNANKDIMLLNGVVQHRTNCNENPKVNIDIGRNKYLNVYYTESRDNIYLTGSEGPPPGVDRSNLIHQRVSIRELFKKQASRRRPAGSHLSERVHSCILSQSAPEPEVHNPAPSPSLISQSPAKPMSPSLSKNFGDCPICMDSLSNNSVASTICGHVFCMRCIEAAFKASGKRCPTCRKVLKKGGYHQLFL